METGTRSAGRVRLVLSYQLFEQHLRAADGTCLVLVEHDLLVQQHRFHAHALVMRRAALLAFAERLHDRGFRVETILSRKDVDTVTQLVDLLEHLRPEQIAWYEPVDDWIERDLAEVCRRAGLVPEVMDTPAFCTTTAQVREQLGPGRPRMQHFYELQRRRLDLLMDGDRPVGGRWSFDAENRKRLPKDVAVPPVPVPAPDRHVEEAVRWVREEHPDAPGDPATSPWPTTRRQALAWLRTFVAERLAGFGPTRTRSAQSEPWLFHSALSPALNLGLLDHSRWCGPPSTTPTRWPARLTRCRWPGWRASSGRWSGGASTCAACTSCTGAGSAPATCSGWTALCRRGSGTPPRGWTRSTSWCAGCSTAGGATTSSGSWCSATRCCCCGSTRTTSTPGSRRCSATPTTG